MAIKNILLLIEQYHFMNVGTSSKDITEQNLTCESNSNPKELKVIECLQ